MLRVLPAWIMRKRGRLKRYAAKPAQSGERKLHKNFTIKARVHWSVVFTVVLFTLARVRPVVKILVPKCVGKKNVLSKVLKRRKQTKACFILNSNILVWTAAVQA